MAENCSIDADFGETTISGETDDKSLFLDAGAERMGLVVPDIQGKGVRRVFSGIIEKSASDIRKYGWIQLENGLHVLLISDGETDKSAASMAVHTGSYDDPETIPGLAHFCEHMLFLGTKKYPEEEYFKKFLTENNGNSNAYTAGTTTNYFFDVSADHFSDALDRFAQFFVDPLFVPNATDREKNAVDSEHAKNAQTDTWRRWQLVRDASNPKHPFHKFGTGNIDTLGIPGIRDEVLRFFDKFYALNEMRLCVLGKETIEELTEVVVKHFGPLQRPLRSVIGPTEPPFRDSDLSLVFKLVPVQDLRQLTILFPLVSSHLVWKEKPGHFISHLLGHESEGSVLAFLKSKSWANELSVGTLDCDETDGLLMISVGLTEGGVEHWEDVTEVVFKYIRLLEKEGVMKWIYDEVAQVAANMFLFKDREQPVKYVSFLAEEMIHIPPSHILSAQHLLFGWNPELVSSALKGLTPNRAIVCVESRTFSGQTTEREKWYGTEFSRTAVTQEQRARWADPQLGTVALPSLNPFLCRNFDVIPSTESSPRFPVRVFESEGLTVFHKLDDTFHLPRAQLRFLFSSPATYSSPRASAFARVFLRILGDNLNSLSYYADLAGISYSLKIIAGGIELSVGGFNEKVGELCDAVSSAMVSFSIQSHRFGAVKEQLVKDMENIALKQPYSNAMYEFSRVLSRNRWHYRSILPYLRAMREDECAAMFQRFLTVRVEALVHGNMDKSEAVAISSSLAKKFPGMPSREEEHEERIMEFPRGLHRMEIVHEDSANVNSAIVSHFQVGVLSLRSLLVLQLLAQIIEDPVFTTLRTQEQLGYAVWSFVEYNDDTSVGGLSFVVQSSVYGAVHLESRILAFVNSFNISNVLADEFERHRKGLLASVLEVDKSLAKETRRWWREIQAARYLFDLKERSVVELETISLDDVCEMWKTLFGEAKRLFSVCVVCATENEKQGEKESSSVLIKDRLEFKRRLRMYPSKSEFIDIAPSHIE